MEVVIIEDEYPAAERLEKMLLKLDASIKILAVLESVEAARNWFAQNALPALIFSDIQLSDGLSFQIFEHMEDISPIIFTTSYDEYAIKAFKVKSIDYLLKPLKSTELESAIAKYKSFRTEYAQTDYAIRLNELVQSFGTTGKKYKSRFLIRHLDQLIPINLDEISYFFTSNQLVCLIKKDGKQFIIDQNLEELESQLDPELFFRLNRQFLVSMDAISNIYAYFNGKLKIELSPIHPDEVLVSREKAGVFKKWIEGT